MEIQVECVALVFVFVGGKDLGDEVVVLGDGGEEDDDSNNFATKLAHRRREDEERLKVVGEGDEGDNSWGSEEVKSVPSPDGVSVVGGGLDNGDEIKSFGLLPVLDLRNRPSDRIRARGESRFFPTLSFAPLEPSRKSGVLLFSPRNSTGRWCRAPWKLVDRLWRDCGSFALLNDENLPLPSRNGHSMTGSSFDMILQDGVRCVIGDEGEEDNVGRIRESNADQTRGMGDEVEDGNATVETSVGL